MFRRCISKVCQPSIHPLRSRSQVVTEEGVPTLYRGLSPVLLGSAPEMAVQVSSSSSLLLPSLELSDTTVYEPSIRALLGTAVPGAPRLCARDGCQGPPAHAFHFGRSILELTCWG